MLKITDHTISKILINRGDVRNRRNQTAVDVAHNPKISNTILKSLKDVKSADSMAPSNIHLGHTVTTSTSMHPYSFHVMKNHLDDMSMGIPNRSPKNVDNQETDFNFNDCKRGYQNNQDSRSISLLFKAVKMGDLSYVSDYFGVAILKDDYDYEHDDEMLPRTRWYVQESLNNNSEDDHDVDESNDLDNDKREKQKQRIDIFGPEGLTPLHVASKVGSINIVQFLLSVGASPHIRLKQQQ